MKVNLRIRCIVVAVFYLFVTAVVAFGEEHKKFVILMEDVYYVLGKPSFTFADPGQFSHDYSVSLLINSPHRIRISGITIWASESQVMFIRPNYTESSEGSSPWYFETGLDALDMQDDPVKYFESIAVNNLEQLPVELRKRILGKMLLLAYYYIEAHQEQEIKTLSTKSDIVKAIRLVLAIPESAITEDKCERIRPSDLWTAAVASQRGTDPEAGKSSELKRE